VLLRDLPTGDDVPKLPQLGTDGQLAGRPRKKSSLFGKLPEIAAYLTDFSYPDGTPIGNVQLAVRTRGPLVVAQLKLAGLGGLRMTVEETDLDSALVALEAALSSEPQPWEPDPYPLDGQGKKKK
jgi:hypothetical protein